MSTRRLSRYRRLLLEIDGDSTQDWHIDRWDDFVRKLRQDTEENARLQRWWGNLLDHTAATYLDEDGLPQRLDARLWDYGSTEQMAVCWLYRRPGGCDHDGYGRVWVPNAYGDAYGQGYQRLHRVMYRYYWEDLAFIDGVDSLVTHQCPHRNCFNPLHLSEGNARTNREDSVEDGTNRLFGKPNDGSRRHFRAISQIDTMKIERALAEGCRLADIARQFGVEVAAVRRIRRQWQRSLQPPS